MSEVKEKGAMVYFDTISKDILTDVEKLHWHSLINMGLRLVSHTDYYKAMSGKAEEIEELEDVLSISSIEDVVGEKKEEKSTKKEEPKEVPSDDFDNRWGM